MKKKELFFLMSCSFLISLVFVGFLLTFYDAFNSDDKNILAEGIESGTETKLGNEEDKTQKIIDGKWALAWHEPFDTFDETKWNIIEGGNNYNQEAQYYKKENVTVRDGSLWLTGKKESYKDHDYTSGKVTTQNKFDMQYGKIEILLRTNCEVGSFPAVWMLPQSGETSPEIDIFESIGIERNAVYYVNHWKENGENFKSHTRVMLDDPDEYHTYSMEWNEKEIKWFIDGQHLFTSTAGIPNEPMYLILNLAIGGGGWAGKPDETSDFPFILEIADIKIWKELS